jgi:hypothetical protein
MLPREAAAAPEALPEAEAAADAAAEDEDDDDELLQALRKAPNAPAAATVAPPRSRFRRESPSAMRSADLFMPFSY